MLLVGALSEVMECDQYIDMIDGSKIKAIKAGMGNIRMALINYLDMFDHYGSHCMSKIDHMDIDKFYFYRPESILSARNLIALDKEFIHKLKEQGYPYMDVVEFIYGYSYLLKYTNEMYLISSIKVAQQFVKIGKKASSVLRLCNSDITNVIYYIIESFKKEKKTFSTSDMALYAAKEFDNNYALGVELINVTKDKYKLPYLEIGWIRNFANDTDDDILSYSDKYDLNKFSSCIEILYKVINTDLNTTSDKIK